MEKLLGVILVTVGGFLLFGNGKVKEEPKEPVTASPASPEEKPVA